MINLSYERKIMNRSKIITATALATVMTAGAAQAEMSLGGLIKGQITDNDGGGITQGYSTDSIYVSYSDTLDNGMGLSLNYSIYGTGHITNLSIDTGMGTVGLGAGNDSAVDKMDGSPACHQIVGCGSSELATYIDADTLSGQSVGYTSPAINGFTVKVTRGMEGATVEPIVSIATKGTIMGATIGAGVSSIDYKAVGTADIDPSFVTVGYSLAGLSLGYAAYDGDNGTDETQFGIGTSMGGFDLGATFADADMGSAADKDLMRLSINKGMGAATFGIDYTETDVAGTDTGDSDRFDFNYVVGF